MDNNTPEKELKTYICDDGNAEVEIVAESPEKAAQEYVDDGSWEPQNETWWCDVWVTEEDDENSRERIKVAVHPEEPECEGDSDHDWQTPHVLVGGMEQHPGVFASGGGVRCHEVCIHCGCEKVTDSWAQDPADGTQGLYSIKYEEEAHFVDVPIGSVDWDAEKIEIENTIIRFGDDTIGRFWVETQRTWPDGKTSEDLEGPLEDRKKAAAMAREIADEMFYSEPDPRDAFRQDT